MAGFKKINLNLYSSQVASNNAGPYAKDNYEGLGLNALGKGKYVGSMNPGYHASGGAPRSVEAMVYSNRVSPVYPWSGAGNTKPQSTLGVPANPYIPLMMDFNSMDLYTYEGVKTPGAEELWEKNFIYENAPIRSHWPQTDRNYNAWGKEAVSGVDDYNVCRPVMGLPFRIQRIPLCINTAAPLVSLSGEPVALDGGDGSGSSTAVSGYFYALATDPVIFTKSGDLTADEPDPELFNGTTVQWISDSGFLPLSTTCAGGGTSRISGLSCDEYTYYDCVKSDCLSLDEGSFALKPQGGGGYRVFSRPLTFTQIDHRFSPCPWRGWTEGVLSAGPHCSGTWEPLCEAILNPLLTESTVNISYSIVASGTSLRNEFNSIGGISAVPLQSHTGHNISSGHFANEIESAFSEWKEAFEHLYPWVTLNFVSKGLESGSASGIPSQPPAPGESGIYNLPLSNIGDIRIGMNLATEEGGTPVVACSYLPNAVEGYSLGKTGSVGGDIHFDGSNAFFKESASYLSGYSIKYAAAHVIGTALGLSSNSSSLHSIMYSQGGKGVTFSSLFPSGLKGSAESLETVSAVYGIGQGGASSASINPYGLLPSVTSVTAENILLGPGISVGRVSGVGGVTLASSESTCSSSNESSQVELSIQWPNIVGYPCPTGTGVSGGCSPETLGLIDSPFNLLKFSEKDFRIGNDEFTRHFKDFPAPDCYPEIFTCDGLHVTPLSGTGAENIEKVVFGEGFNISLNDDAVGQTCVEDPDDSCETTSYWFIGPGGGGTNAISAQMLDVPAGVCRFTFHYITGARANQLQVRWDGAQGELVFDSGFVATGGRGDPRFDWPSVRLPDKPEGVTKIWIGCVRETPYTQEQWQEFMDSPEGVPAPDWVQEQGWYTNTQGVCFCPTEPIPLDACLCDDADGRVTVEVEPILAVYGEDCNTNISGYASVTQWEQYIAAGGDPPPYWNNDPSWKDEPLGGAYHSGIKIRTIAFNPGQYLLDYDPSTKVAHLQNKHPHLYALRDIPATGVGELGEGAGVPPQLEGGWMGKDDDRIDAQVTTSTIDQNSSTTNYRVEFTPNSHCGGLNKCSDPDIPRWQQQLTKWSSIEVGDVDILLTVEGHGSGTYWENQATNWKGEEATVQIWEAKTRPEKDPDTVESPFEFLDEENGGPIGRSTMLGMLGQKNMSGAFDPSLNCTLESMDSWFNDGGEQPDPYIWGYPDQFETVGDPVFGPNPYVLCANKSYVIYIHARSSMTCNENNLHPDGIEARANASGVYFDFNLNFERLQRSGEGSSDSQVALPFSGVTFSDKFVVGPPAILGGPYRDASQYRWDQSINGPPPSRRPCPDNWIYQPKPPSFQPPGAQWVDLTRNQREMDSMGRSYLNKVLYAGTTNDDWVPCDPSPALCYLYRPNTPVYNMLNIDRVTPGVFSHKPERAGFSGMYKDRAGNLLCDSDEFMGGELTCISGRNCVGETGKRTYWGETGYDPVNSFPGYLNGDTPDIWSDLLTTQAINNEEVECLAFNFPDFTVTRPAVEVNGFSWYTPTNYPAVDPKFGSAPIQVFYAEDGQVYYNVPYILGGNTNNGSRWDKTHVCFPPYEGTVSTLPIQKVVALTGYSGFAADEEAYEDAWWKWHQENPDAEREPRWLEEMNWYYKHMAIATGVNHLTFSGVEDREWHIEAVGDPCDSNYAAKISLPGASCDFFTSCLDTACLKYINWNGDQECKCVFVPPKDYIPEHLDPCLTWDEFGQITNICDFVHKDKDCPGPPPGCPCEVLGADPGILCGNDFQTIQLDIIDTTTWQNISTTLLDWNEEECYYEANFQMWIPSWRITPVPRAGGEWVINFGPDENDVLLNTLGSVLSPFPFKAGLTHALYPNWEFNIGP